MHRTVCPSDNFVQGLMEHSLSSNSSVIRTSEVARFLSFEENGGKSHRPSLILIFWKHNALFNRAPCSFLSGAIQGLCDFGAIVRIRSPPLRNAGWGTVSMRWSRCPLVMVILAWGLYTPEYYAESSWWFVGVWESTYLKKKKITRQDTFTVHMEVLSAAKPQMSWIWTRSRLWRRANRGGSFCGFGSLKTGDTLL